MSRKKDLILVLALLVLALLFLLLSRTARKPAAVSPAPPPAETGMVTEEKPAESYADFVSETVRAYFEEYPAASYLFVNTGGSAYSPIPLNGDNSFRIAQQDGSENVIHIGENSFYMESSNCKNQNCVGQGEVTLENRESRPLFNMVICLPHNLSLELLTREEAEARLLEMYAKDPPPAA
ncbi:MAG: NusG domain II-containing protein [Oscillospiraceae bacterium]|nr:NusG domain II-containing protein [Oscillospiraceae bacterium]